MDSASELIDKNQGVIWAYRFLLGREPDDQPTINHWHEYWSSPAELRALILASPECTGRFERAGVPPEDARFPVDLREGILWGIRLYLCREPQTDEIEALLPRVGSARDIAGLLLLSREFEEQRGFGAEFLRDLMILGHFAPFHTVAPPAEFFADFLGGVTRLAYLPPSFAPKAGTVESGPKTMHAGMHGPSEWVATLRSVMEARDTFVAVELGCGWAPWLASSGIAARKCGISDCHLIGVEGSLEHIEFARQNFRDNGLNPEAHRLLHAVAGATDGVARFPKLLEPSVNYGANAARTDEKVAEKFGLGEWEEVECISILTLLKDLGRVNLIHCDVQGWEGAIIPPAIGKLNECTRRIVVGTHSRRIESELLEVFSAHGWILEHEEACTVQQFADGSINLIKDGEQIWRNPRLYEH